MNYITLALSNSLFAVAGIISKQNIRFLFCSKNRERGAAERFNNKSES